MSSFLVHIVSSKFALLIYVDIEMSLRQISKLNTTVEIKLIVLNAKKKENR